MLIKVLTYVSNIKNIFITFTNSANRKEGQAEQDFNETVANDFNQISSLHSP